MVLPVELDAFLLLGGRQDFRGGILDIKELARNRARVPDLDRITTLPARFNTFNSRSGISAAYSVL
jgi:hypothetical protein